MLVGCKSDIKDNKSFIEKLKASNEQLISFRQGEQLTKKLNILGYVECSSLNKQDVKEGNFILVGVLSLVNFMNDY